MENVGAKIESEAKRTRRYEDVDLTALYALAGEEIDLQERRTLLVTGQKDPVAMANALRKAATIGCNQTLLEYIY